MASSDAFHDPMVIPSTEEDQDIFNVSKCAISQERYAVVRETTLSNPSICRGDQIHGRFSFPVGLKVATHGLGQILNKLIVSMKILLDIS